MTSVPPPDRTDASGSQTMRAKPGFRFLAAPTKALTLYRSPTDSTASLSVTAALSCELQTAARFGRADLRAPSKISPALTSFQKPRVLPSVRTASSCEQLRPAKSGNASTRVQNYGSEISNLSMTTAPLRSATAELSLSPTMVA